MLVAPAESPVPFNLDASPSSGRDELPVRLMPMSDAPFVEDQPLNPEEEIPLSDLERVAVLNPVQPLRSLNLRYSNDNPFTREEEQPLCKSNDMADLTNYLEEPRSMPPRPHPGPRKVMAQEDNAKIAAPMPSPAYSSSPAGQHRLHMGPADVNPQLRSPERVDQREVSIFNASQSLEKVRLSETSRELPQLLQSAFDPRSAPIDGALNSSFGGGMKAATQAAQAQGIAVLGGAYNPDETKFLRDLVGMQHVQMMELQKQISDLHGLVTGMTNQRSSDARQEVSDCKAAAAATLVPVAARGTVDSGRADGQPVTATADHADRVSPTGTNPTTQKRCDAKVGDSIALPASRKCDAKVGDSIALPASRTCDARVGDSIALPASRNYDAKVGDSIELPATVRGRSPIRSCEVGINTSFQGSGISKLLCQEQLLEALPGRRSVQSCAENSAAVAQSPTPIDVELSVQLVHESLASPLTPTRKVPCVPSSAQGSTCTAGVAHVHDSASSLSSLAVPPLPSRSSNSAANIAETDTVEQNTCTDSADTAGGGMPRKPPQQVDSALWATLSTGTPAFNSLGPNEAILSDDVPRIIYASSDSSEDSDLEDGDIASDVGSLDSAPPLGLALGLATHRMALKSYPR
jgi:hypothetical protein